MLVQGGMDEKLVFKLSDLSLTTTSCASSIMSATGSIKDIAFTLLYLAPELVNPQLNIRSKPNAMTDIFAFAITMYEILFPDQNVNCFISPFQYLQAIKNDWRPEVPPTSEILMDSLIFLLKKAWSKDPLTRPSAEEIYQEAEKVKVHIKKMLSATADFSEVDHQVCNLFLSFLEQCFFSLSSVFVNLFISTSLVLA